MNALHKYTHKRTKQIARALTAGGLCVFVFLCGTLFTAGPSYSQGTLVLGCPTSQAAGNCICDPQSCDRFDEVPRPVNTTQPIPPRGACEGGVNPGAFDDQPHFETLVNFLYELWLPPFVYMTEQFTTVMMHQMLVIGSFFDAKHQLENLRLHQDLQAQSHERYHSSVQMCRFGSNVKSLPASEMRARVNAQILDKALADRQHLNRMTSSALGDYSDFKHRITQFSNLYCSLFESGARIGPMCDYSAGPADRIGRDIDYARLFENRYTLDIDYINPPPAGGGNPADIADQEDILALSKNLFASTVFPPMNEDLIRQPDGQDIFMDMRSAMATRSMARYSFSQLVGMRTPGTPEVAPYLHTIIEELGVPRAELDDFLGENPSYFAQMEVLTKKMFQNPVFFTNLYENPQNVERTGVAIQALKLMHDRDRFESAQRRELLISLILELKLRGYQDTMNRRLVSITPRIIDLD